jgi:hypothetical protein
MAQPIGTIGTIPTLTIGGRVYTDISSNLKRLITHVAATGGGTFRLFSGSAGYAVTTGKTLTIESLRREDLSSTVGTGIAMAQTDNDIGLNSATALTNAVYWGGSNTLTPSISTGSGTNVVADIYFPVAALKYCTMTNSTTNDVTFQAWGYEA